MEGFYHFLYWQKLAGLLKSVKNQLGTVNIFFFFEIFLMTFFLNHFVCKYLLQNKFFFFLVYIFKNLELHAYMYVLRQFEVIGLDYIITPLM